MDSAASPHMLADLKARIAPFERCVVRSGRRLLPFGVAALDDELPEGGLAGDALHEVAGFGPELEHGAAAALFTAGILARLKGPVLWCFARPDLFAPALAGVGLDPSRVIYAETGDRDRVLAVFEDGLRHRGLAGVVAEIETRLSLTATRRLQLAAEASGVIGFALRRGRKINEAWLAEPSAAVTRWRIAALPSAPPLVDAPGVPGLGRARWRLDLVRVRGAKPGSWIVEACDAQGRLGLAAQLADGSLAAPEARRAAG